MAHVGYWQCCSACWMCFSSSSVMMLFTKCPDYWQFVCGGMFGCPEQIVIRVRRFSVHCYFDAAVVFVVDFHVQKGYCPVWFLFMSEFDVPIGVHGVLGDLSVFVRIRAWFFPGYRLRMFPERASALCGCSGCSFYFQVFHEETAHNGSPMANPSFCLYMVPLYSTYVDFAMNFRNPEMSSIVRFVRFLSVLSFLRRSCTMYSVTSMGGFSE